MMAPKYKTQYMVNAMVKMNYYVYTIFDTNTYFYNFIAHTSVCHLKHLGTQ